MHDNMLLLSGGLDSTVLAYWLVKNEKRKVRGLYFDFNRPASRYELSSARKVAFQLDMPLEVLKLGALDQLMTGYLPNEILMLGDIDLAEQRELPTPVMLHKADNIFPVVLSIASYYAHGLEIDEVALALTAEEIQTPSRLSTFFDSFSNVLHEFSPTLPKVRFVTPLSSYSKPEIIAKGVESEISLEETWSCYRGHGVHCGICTGCKQRRTAFQQSKIEDKTVYRSAASC